MKTCRICGRQYPDTAADCPYCSEGTIIAPNNPFDPSVLAAHQQQRKSGGDKKAYIWWIAFAVSFVLSALVAWLIISLGKSAQPDVEAMTPAERLDNFAKNMPPGTTLLGQFADPERQCAFYLHESRLFVYDAQTEQTTEVAIPMESSADRIVSAELTTDESQIRVFVFNSSGSRMTKYMVNTVTRKVE